MEIRAIYLEIFLFDSSWSIDNGLRQLQIAVER